MNLGRINLLVAGKSLGLIGLLLIASNSIFGNPVVGTALSASGSLLGLCGWHFYSLGKRRSLKQRRGPVDAGQNILYLRPFKEDSERARPVLPHFPWGGSQEEQIIEVFNEFGVVSSFGRPGEKLPPLGAEREYFDDSRWRDHIKQKFLDASTIVIRPGRSRSIEWELQEVARTVSPTKIVIIIQSPDEFFNTIDLLQKVIPLETGGARQLIPRRRFLAGVITFDREWRMTFRAARPNKALTQFTGSLSNPLAMSLLPYFIARGWKIKIDDRPLHAMQYLCIGGVLLSIVSGALAWLGNQSSGTHSGMYLLILGVMWSFFLLSALKFKMDRSALARTLAGLDESDRRPLGYLRRAIMIGSGARFSFFDATIKLTGVISAAIMLDYLFIFLLFFLAWYFDREGVLAPALRAGIFQAGILVAVILWLRLSLGELGPFLHRVVDFRQVFTRWSSVVLAMPLIAFFSTVGLNQTLSAECLEMQGEIDSIHPEAFEDRLDRAIEAGRRERLTEWYEARCKSSVEISTFLLGEFELVDWVSFAVFSLVFGTALAFMIDLTVGEAGYAVPILACVFMAKIYEGHSYSLWADSIWLQGPHGSLNGISGWSFWIAAFSLLSYIYLRENRSVAFMIVASFSAIAAWTFFIQAFRWVL